jgi:hypothetical protein
VREAADSSSDNQLDVDLIPPLHLFRGENCILKIAWDSARAPQKALTIAEMDRQSQAIE